MFKMFVTVDKHLQIFYSANEIYQALTLIQQRFFFKVGYFVFSCVMAFGSSVAQHSIL